MGNRIIRSIIEEKINRFKYAFERSAPELFIDPETWKLSHPWEYWSFREVASKEFLRSLMPSKFEIGSWFILSPNIDWASTQCDIIIFDKENTPLIESSENQKFYPVETVVWIGEVKSILSKTEFIYALNKLARNKSIKETVWGSLVNWGSERLNPVINPYHALFSFIICKKLDFKLESLHEELDGFYEADIKPWQKHNVVLSIDDGILQYYDNKDWMTLMYPYIKSPLKNRFTIPTDNKNLHFFHFLNSFLMAMSSQKSCHPEMAHYIKSFDWGIHLNQINL